MNVEYLALEMDMVSAAAAKQGIGLKKAAVNDAVGDVPTSSSVAAPETKA